MVEHNIQQEPNAAHRTQRSPKPAAGPCLADPDTMALFTEGDSET